MAEAYRLLKAIMNTAVSDGMIKQNPCTVKGGGAENSPERPVLSISEVFALAEAIDRRYRALVLLATFTNLRWGEAVALRRKDVDLKARTVRVERTLVEVTGKPLHFGPPKTEAGARTVPIPAIVLPELKEHVKTFAHDGDKGLIFVGGKGALLRRANSGATGCGPWTRRGSRVCASTTCGTRGTPSPRSLGRRSQNSRNAWAMPATARP